MMVKVISCMVLDAPAYIALLNSAWTPDEWFGARYGDSDADRAEAEYERRVEAEADAHFAACFDVEEPPMGHHSSCHCEECDPQATERAKLWDTYYKAGLWCDEVDDKRRYATDAEWELLVPVVIAAEYAYRDARAAWEAHENVPF